MNRIAVVVAILLVLIVWLILASGNASQAVAF